MESFTIKANLLLVLVVLLVSVLGSVSAYKNYTVGDSLGWYDKLQKPNVDYQKWVLGKTFSLGDFLSKIFFFFLLFKDFLLLPFSKSHLDIRFRHNFLFHSFILSHLISCH